MTHQTNEYHPAMEWEAEACDLGVDCNGIGPAECVQLAAEEADHWRTAYDDLHYRVDCLLERLNLCSTRWQLGGSTDVHAMRTVGRLTTEFAAEFRSPTTMKKDTNAPESTERRLVPRRAVSEHSDRLDALARRLEALEATVRGLVGDGR